MNDFNNTINLILNKREEYSKLVQLVQIYSPPEYNNSHFYKEYITLIEYINSLNIKDEKIGYHDFILFNINFETNKFDFSKINKIKDIISKYVLEKIQSDDNYLNEFIKVLSRVLKENTYINTISDKEEIERLTKIKNNLLETIRKFFGKDKKKFLDELNKYNPLIFFQEHDLFLIVEKISDLKNYYLNLVKKINERNEKLFNKYHENLLIEETIKSTKDYFKKNKDRLINEYYLFYIYIQLEVIKLKKKKKEYTLKQISGNNLACFYRSVSYIIFKREDYYSLLKFYSLFNIYRYKKIKIKNDDYFAGLDYLELEESDFNEYYIENSLGDSSIWLSLFKYFFNIVIGVKKDDDDGLKDEIGSLQYSPGHFNAYFIK